jgi:biotin-(acetyl-CoA carboxylase) ligase
MPPGFRAFVLAAGEDAFARACQLAGSHGAGALFVAGDPETLDLAVVLEPEERLSEARRAICLGMLALADALVPAAPPERPIRIRWPATLLVDGGVVGGGRLAWPAGAAETELPAWLVFGTRLRLAWPDNFEPGTAPGRTALAEEGFELEPTPLVENFARHLLFHADAWAAHGFEPVCNAYAKLLHPPGRIDARGDLFQGKYPLAAKLLAPDWLEAA